MVLGRSMGGFWTLRCACARGILIDERLREVALLSSAALFTYHSPRTRYTFSFIAFSCVIKKRDDFAKSL